MDLAKFFYLFHLPVDLLQFAPEIVRLCCGEHPQYLRGPESLGYGRLDGQLHRTGGQVTFQLMLMLNELSVCT